MVNLAQICERYGGGGHARVGAISFPPDQEDEGPRSRRGDCGRAESNESEGVRRGGVGFQKRGAAISQFTGGEPGPGRR